MYRTTFSLFLVLTTAACAAQVSPGDPAGPISSRQRAADDPSTSDDAGTTGDGSSTADAGTGDSGGGDGGGNSDASSNEGTCDSADPPLQGTFASSDALAAAIVGRWSLCTSGPTEAPYAFGAADLAGVEITADGHLYVLAADASGALSRSAVDPAWDVSYLDTSAMNGPGVYQINLASSAGGSDAFAWISASGNHLGLEATMTEELGYVRIP